MATCSCELGRNNRELGFSNFPSASVSNEDPLVERFKEEKWSFQNPILKQSQEMSVLDVINTQSYLNINDLQEHPFKMYPPIKVRTKEEVHGFPKHLVEEEGIKAAENNSKKV